MLQGCESGIRENCLFQTMRMQRKQKELQEQEQYTQSNEYKEKVAKDKLGLVYDNETIFREK